MLSYLKIDFIVEMSLKTVLGFSLSEFCTMLLNRTMLTTARSFSRHLTRFYSAAAQAQSAESSTSSEGIPLEKGAPSPLPGDSRKVSATVESLVEQIANLPLIEVSDLNYALKKRLNIPDAPFMSAGFALAAPSTAAPAAETVSEEATGAPQKISFAVKLVGFDDTKKIALIKQIRDVVPGLNLVQAKKFVEGIPVEVKNDMGKTEAEELKAAIEKVGGKVEIV